MWLINTCHVLYYETANWSEMNTCIAGSKEPVQKMNSVAIQLHPSLAAFYIHMHPDYFHGPPRSAYGISPVLTVTVCTSLHIWYLQNRLAWRHCNCACTHLAWTQCQQACHAIDENTRNGACMLRVQSCISARQARALLPDLARYEGPGVDGLALGEEVWVLASSGLGGL